jgi:hypothetical protein
MNFRKTGRNNLHMPLLAVFLTLARAQGPQVSRQPRRDLEMTLRRDAGVQDQTKLPRFQLELRNVGEHDLVLNLGITLANGSRQYPQAIVLTIVDPQGKSRPFDLIEPGGVAGRMDPLILPLPVGSAFSLPIDLSKYWPAASKEFEFRFYRGRYSLEARFTGKGVSSQETNLDVKGIALMPYWTGTATSNRLQFEVDKQRKLEPNGEHFPRPASWFPPRLVLEEICFNLDRIMPGREPALAQGQSNNTENHGSDDSWQGIRRSKRIVWLSRLCAAHGCRR